MTRAVLVEFLDHCHVGPGQWIPRGDLSECTPCSVLTVAWLVAETDDAYVVAASLTPDDATGVFTIVKSCVLRLEPVVPVGRLRSRSQPSHGRLLSWLFGSRDSVESMPTT